MVKCPKSMRDIQYIYPYIYIGKLRAVLYEPRLAVTLLNFVRPFCRAAQTKAFKVQSVKSAPPMTTTMAAAAMGNPELRIGDAHLGDQLCTGLIRCWDAEKNHKSVH